MSQDSIKDQANLEIYYFLVVNLWQQFCEEHNELFQITCDEYAHLLNGEIDQLEQVIPRKETVIGHIRELERNRSGLISKINQNLGDRPPIESVSDLIVFFQNFEGSKENHHLRKFNSLLISIIEKIQEQNKKNQIFLNKSIKSVKEIKEGLLGKKAFPIYNSQGISHKNLTR